ncbi:MAG: MATE family efflux transporter [bacterium]
MGSRPVGRLLVSFSLPALIGMLVNATYNIVDTAFVGRLGHEAIAALTVVWPLNLVMIALSIGVGVGANSLIARRLGTGDREQANRAGAQAILLSLLSGGLVAVVVMGRIEPVLRLLGATPELMPFARDYLGVIVPFAPLVFFPMVANNLIRAEGNPLPSMMIMVFSAVANIILDPLLIFGPGPFPALGVRGAAIATVIAHGLGVLLYAGYFLSRHSGYRFRPRDFLPAPRLWAAIYAVGAPAMAIQLSGSVVNAVINNIAVSYGPMMLAALGVIFRLFSFAFMPCLGISHGVLPLVGYNYGAGRLDRVREVVIKGALAATAVTAGASLLFIAFPGFFVGIFNREPEFLAAAARGLRITSLAFAPVGAAIVFTSFFQGIGRAVPAMLLSLTRQFILLLPAALLLSRLAGMTGLWVSLPVSDGLTFLASLGWTLLTFHRLGIPLLRRRARGAAVQPSR